MFFIGFNVFRGLMGLVMLPFAIWAAWWTFRDVSTKGLRHPWLWAGISFSIFPIGFIVYLVYRLLGKNKI